MAVKTSPKKKGNIAFRCSSSVMIWEGKKKLIIQADNFKNDINKSLYLVDNKHAFGKIKLSKPRKINIKDFNDLLPYHLMSKAERIERFGDTKQLYAYPFELELRFAIPKPIKPFENNEVFQKDFGFHLIEHSLIKNVKTYEPTEITNEELIDDHKVVHSWYSSKQSGKKVTVKVDDIVRLHNSAVREMKKRGFEHEIATELDRSILIPNYNKSDLSEFQSIIVQKDFISLVNNSEDTRKGVDILVRADAESIFKLFKKAVESQIASTFDKKLQEDLQITWGDGSSFDTFAPMYDLKLERTHPLKHLTMSELTGFAPLRTFTLLKSDRKAFSEMDGLINHLFGDVNGP